MKRNIELINNGDSQDIVITIDGISKVIYSLDNISEELYCDFIEDNNYVIIYSTRVVDIDDPYYMTKFRHIRAVYDLNNNEMLDLNKETINSLFFMYLAKSCFSLKIVFSFLTGNNYVGDTREISNFYNYLTGHNRNISIEDAKKYVLSCYPELEEFKNIKSYLLNKRKINNIFEKNYLTFHVMKQDIRELNNQYSNNKELIKK